MSTIIQTEQKSNSGPKSTNAGTVAAGSDDKAKDISGIVEQILWKQHQSRNSNVNDFYDQIQNRDESTAKKKKRKKQTLMLNRVNDSDVAVFQSILTDNDNSNMKDEVRKITNIFAFSDLKYTFFSRLMKFIKCSRKTPSSDLTERLSIYLIPSRELILQLYQRKVLISLRTHVKSVIFNLRLRKCSKFI